MSKYRRIRRKGATYFFTVNLARRDDTLLVDHLGILRDAYCTVQKEMPFKTDAVVILPNHIHAIWTMPTGDADFSTRWKKIKREFTVNLGQRRAVSHSKRRRGEAGIWQRRFWEHMVRDDADLRRCLTYTLCNPVKHNLVDRPVDWPHSSIHRDIRAGRLPQSGL